MERGQNLNKGSLYEDLHEFLVSSGDDQAQYHNQAFQKEQEEEEFDIQQYIHEDNKQSSRKKLQKQILYLDNEDDSLGFEGYIEEENKHPINEELQQQIPPANEEEFEFEEFFYQNKGQNQSPYLEEEEVTPEKRKDSERSNFTQESCSPPDTGGRQGQTPTQFNVEDFSKKLEAKKVQLISPKSFMDGDQVADNQFSLNSSPGKDSLHQSFQGQFTSNFAPNLKDSSIMRIREASDPNASQAARESSKSLNHQLEEGHTFSAGDQSNVSGRFSASFNKYEGQKIRDFDKVNLIKFEEFEAFDSQHSDSNKKLSERGISDRIYERGDFQKHTPQILSPFDEQLGDDENQDDQENQPTSPYYNERQLPLFVITEEEHSEIQSSYHTFNKMQSIDSSQIDKQGGTQNENYLRLNQEQAMLFNQVPSLNSGVSREQYSQIYQKSKSQPINQRHNSSKSANRLTQGSNNFDPQPEKVLKTETSPIPSKKKNPHYSPSQIEIKGGGQFNYSRASTESPRVANYDNDQVSNYFQKMQSQYNQRSNNMINNTNPDFLMSDEDLLSNIDRVSKILPTNEISEDDQRIMREEDQSMLMQRMKEYKQIIDHLKCENQNKQTLILIKESQMNLLQLKNEELEEKISELENQIAGIPDQKQATVDASTQLFVDQEDFPQERKKIRRKNSKFQNNSGAKKTPSRINDSILDANFGQALQVNSKNSSLNSYAFDTPQVKLDKILRESPTTTSRHPSVNLGVQKQHSTSFNADEISQFKQQVAFMRQQLQRSEENNLTMQQKIEKQKRDKNIQKERIFELSIEKNDLTKAVNQLEKEAEQSFRKFEGLKLDIQEYKRHIEVLDIKLKQKNNLIDREVQAKQQLTQLDECLQTDFLFSKKDGVFVYPPSQSQDEGFQNQQPHKLFFDLDHQSVESSQSSTKSLINPQQQQHITIINNKQELQLLLGRAKDYEQMSLQLQNEINEHRRVLKDNQEKVLKQIQEQQDQKRRIKKREVKIQKLKSVNLQIEKDKIELKLKLQDALQKNNDLRLKMEAKLQEKEFKIITLKNQMKAFPYSQSGILTPATPNNNTSLNKQYNQHDLYGLISSLIHQQVQGQLGSEMASRRISTDNLLKQRAKSHDQQNQPNTSFSNAYENIPASTNNNNKNLDEPKIMTSLNNNMIFYGQGENPSFSHNNDHNTFSITTSKVPQHLDSHNQYYQHIHSPSQNYVSHNYKKSLNIPISLQAQHDYIGQDEDEDEDPGDNVSEIQQIFNSSIKRINLELESIKDINSNASALINDRTQQNRRKQSSKNKVVYQYNPIREVEEYKVSRQHQLRGGGIQYEDSLQTQKSGGDAAAEEHYNKEWSHFYDKDEGGKSEISNIYVEQEHGSKEKRHSIFQDPLNDKLRPEFQNIQRKVSSLQNTHTFRKINSHAQNTPNSNHNRLKSISQHEKLGSFSQVQAYPISTVADKDHEAQFNLHQQQNTSILYDFKPAFENSNLMNTTSQLNQTQTAQIRNTNNEPMIVSKFDTQTQSLNSSLKYEQEIQQLKHRQEYQHLRLNSNLITNRDEDTISPKRIENMRQIENDSIKKKQIEYLEDEIEPEDKANSSNSASSSYRRYKSIGPAYGKKPKGAHLRLSSKVKYSDMRGQQEIMPPPQFKIASQTFGGQFSASDEMNIPYFRNQQSLMTQHMNSGVVHDGSKSTLSNYSQKLEDLKRKYGRISNN